MTSLHFIYVSGDSRVAQTVKNPPTMQETQVQSLGQEDPLEKEMTTHSSIPAWRIPWTEQPDRHGPWGCKELDTFQRLSLSLVCVCAREWMNSSRDNAIALVWILCRPGTYRSFWLLSVTCLQLQSQLIIPLSECHTGACLGWSNSMWGGE